MSRKNGKLLVEVVDESGIPADVEKNVNTEINELMVNLGGHECSHNTTKQHLLANETYLGDEWQDMLDYGNLTISVHSDVDSAPDGLEIKWSQDGITQLDRDVFTISANIAKSFTFGPTQRYYRVSYTNGDTDQTDFNLTSIIRRSYVKPSSHRITDPIVSDDDAELVKSVITGIKPDGTFSNANLTPKSNFKVSLDEYGDTPAIDAFDRLRISEPFTIFDSKQLHDKQPLFWDESIGGSATSVHNPTNACTSMTVTANASDFVIRQTKQRFNYQPGKSQLIMMTFHSPQIAGLTKRIGTFSGTGTNNLSPNNGIFFECDGSVSWNIAKAGTVTETVTQANWNVDKLDGNGLSAKTLDLNAAQILVIDYEWLGVGRVRVGFVIDGIITYVHHFNHANDDTFSSVYMSTPNLPLRYDIQSDGAASGTLDHICSTLMSEGGIEETGVLRTINTGTTKLDANDVGTAYALIGMRLKATYNDVTVMPTGISLLAANNDDFLWELILNPTVSGTFTYSDLLNSSIQGAIGTTTNTVSDGTVIASGYNTGNSSVDVDLKTALRLGSSIDETLDTLVLSIRPLSTGLDVYGSLSFRELL